MSEEKVYAYKVTIKETIGEVSRTTVLETDNLDLTVDVLGLQDRVNVINIKQSVNVDSDLPNRNITKEWQELIKRANERRDAPIQEDPYAPFSEGFPCKKDTAGKYPWEKHPFTYEGPSPFTITC